MYKTIEFLVGNSEAFSRVDVYLSKEINYLTRSFIKKIIKEKNLIINGNIVDSPSAKIKANDKIILNLNIKENNNLIPKKIKLDIVFEDKDIAIINKPKGMVVHPGAGNFDNTLANALSFKFKNKLSDVNGKLRPGIVHRLDKNTSGLLIVAKNNLAHVKLAKQFNNHSIKRKYKCLVWGVIRPFNGRLETLITRNKKNRKLMTVDEVKGKKAITNYKTIRVFNKKTMPAISYLECQLETGRTHQIRVHLDYKGTSIIGDSQYGKKKIKFKKINKTFLKMINEIQGQALHAETLEFLHPTKNKLVSFKSKIPSDFSNLLNFLSNLKS